MPVHGVVPGAGYGATAASSSTAKQKKRFVVETITTMTTVTERRIIREAHEDVAAAAAAAAAVAAAGGVQVVPGSEMLPPALPAKASATAAAAAAAAVAAAAAAAAAANADSDYDEQKPPPIPPKETSATQISGILKGGKLWKQDSISQVSNDLLPHKGFIVIPSSSFSCSNRMIRTTQPQRMRAAPQNVRCAL